MTDKEQMMKDAALVALKRQAEWYDMPQPTEAEIQTRINQVCQYETNNDATLVAMKDVVLQHLSMRLQVKAMQEALAAKTLLARLKRLFGRSV